MKSKSKQLSSNTVRKLANLSENVHLNEYLGYS